VVRIIQLGTSVDLTHINGIEEAGWDTFTMKVYGLTMDLNAYVMTVRAIAFIDPVAITYDDNYTSDTIARDAQVRQPKLPLYVNGSVDPGDPSRVYPDADQSAQLEDSLTETVTAEMTYPTGIGESDVELQLRGCWSSTYSYHYPYYRWYGMGWGKVDRGPYI
jgi:hypothetical protein